MLWHSRRSQKGVSLIEVTLVLAIASTIIMLGMQQYKSMKRDSDVDQILYNVNQIFQAAADYYQANCRRQMDPSTGLQVGTAGTLDPQYTPAPTNPYPVTVAALSSAGFLAASLPVSPLVNTAGSSGGYMVQFNLVTPYPDRTLSLYTGDTAKLGQIILWRVQVSVNLKNAATANLYKNILRVDCLSSLSGDGLSVLPCASSTGGTYAVWERLPSLAVPESNSNFWMTNAANKEFNELYQALPVLYLTNVPTSSYPQQYYLCGS